MKKLMYVVCVVLLLAVLNTAVFADADYLQVSVASTTRDAQIPAYFLIRWSHADSSISAADCAAGLIYISATALNSSPTRIGSISTISPCVTPKYP